MMMERRHRENTATGQLKTDHLENDRNRFNHEDTTDYDQEEFLFTADRDHADHPPKGQRAGVTHENFCRVAIEPKKSETGTDERGTHYRQLAGEWVKRNLQIFRDSKISRGVGEQRVGES